MTLAELNAEMPLGDVFFDYDMSTIRDDARPILQKNADYLRRWTTTRVSVEGHADSRGTAEYNLALGERRASAIRDYLVSLGIAAIGCWLSAGARKVRSARKRTRRVAA